MLNGRFILDQARFLAERIVKEAGSCPEAQVERAFELAFGRPPEPVEREAAVRLIGGHGVAVFCRALLNTNEFVYVM